jgi:hypothetical protein
VRIYAHGGIPSVANSLSLKIFDGPASSENVEDSPPVFEVAKMKGTPLLKEEVLLKRV